MGRGTWVFIVKLEYGQGWQEARKKGGGKGGQVGEGAKFVKVAQEKLKKIEMWSHLLLENAKRTTACTTTV